MAAFNLVAKSVIESATLDLSAGQLAELAEAAPALRTVCEAFAGESGDMTQRPPELAALDSVERFLAAVESLVHQVGVIQPKRVMTKRGARKAK